MPHPSERSRPRPSVPAPSRRAALLSVLCALAAAGGCSSETPRTPEATVRAFAVAVQAAREDPSLRRRVYDLLSARARQTLRERAQLASQVSGWELQPWEMLAPGRMRLRVSFDFGAVTAHVTGARAIVTVRGASGGVADVPLVHEEGGWRVDLDLPPFDPGRGSMGDAGSAR